MQGFPARTGCFATYRKTLHSSFQTKGEFVMAFQNFSSKSVCCIFICLAVILWIPAAGYADGELDTTFDPGTGPNYGVYAVAVQSDGKIVIGGVRGSPI